MRKCGSMMRSGAGWVGLVGLVAVVGIGVFGRGPAAVAGPKKTKVDPVALGREIFNREWLPGDKRSHGGDGLGPVYNDTSCVACHNSGGAGGGGPVGKNIDILSASRNGGRGNFAMMGGMPGGGTIQPVSGPQAVNTPGNTPGGGGPPANGSNQPQAANLPAPNNAALFAIHPGFRDGRTVVLHKFGSDPNYDAWRRGVGTGSVVPGNVTLTNVGVGSTFVTATVQDAPNTITEQIVEQPREAPPTSTEVAVPPSVPAAPQQALSVAPQQAGIDIAVGARNPQQAPQNDVIGARIQELQMAMNNGMGGVQRGQFVSGEFTLSRSQRNPTSLFGLGLIDSISEKAIIEGAGQRNAKFPEIVGRVSRLKDGRVGRLGWKGQTANSEDFVLTACAVELGLEVPGHHQSLTPQAPKYKASGMDLTADECAGLVAYVRNLPRPIERIATDTAESDVLASGKTLFASVGCAACHAPSVGGVDGIYSDLLLHDMGAEMAESGSYNGGSGDDEDPLNPVLGNGGKPGAPQPVAADRPATRQEWRTPPLWGVRDSAPYLHDGRAQTLEQAIAGHGGTGANAARRFFELSPKERLSIEAFLKSMVAPDSDSDPGA